jgi:hypothetical protein
MNVNVLIDAIVRQTTVLIAQLATAAGVRAPLAHTANQVFVDLVRELKEQGLGNKVIADMFGLALSTYHSKIRRLSESRSERGRSLWEATHAFVRERGPVNQADVLGRFQYDDDATVRGVLTDLVESGLVFRAGRGDRTTYRAAKPEELSLVEAVDARASAINFLWLAIHRSGPASRAALAELVPFDSAILDDALATLVRDGRVEVSGKTGEAQYTSEDCIIPLGDPAGWEAAVFDHYQALVTALCAKLRQGQRRTSAQDAIGGSTYGFTVWPGHPHHDEVLGFLGRMRAEAASLRSKVRAHNTDAAHPPPDAETIGVIAYFGQTVITSETAEVLP